MSIDSRESGRQDGHMLTTHPGVVCRYWTCGAPPAPSVADRRPPRPTGAADRSRRHASRRPSSETRHLAPLPCALPLAASAPRLPSRASSLLPFASASRLSPADPAALPALSAHARLRTTAPRHACPHMRRGPARPRTLLVPALLPRPGSDPHQKERDVRTPHASRLPTGRLSPTGGRPDAAALDLPSRPARPRPQRLRRRRRAPRPAPPSSGPPRTSRATGTRWSAAAVRSSANWPSSTPR